jgi:YHS domain-containing protein
LNPAVDTIFRNVREPVEPFAAVRIGARTEHLALDPVCNMVVDGSWLVEAHVRGPADFFCTLTCAGEFARTPERFVEQSAR